MAEKERPVTLPGKELGTAKASDHPKDLSESQVAQIVSEECGPAGTLQEKSVKEVMEVSADVKTPSSAGEGVFL